MVFRFFIFAYLTILHFFLYSQNVFRILETERGYPLWDQAYNNDGNCNPSYNEKFPNSDNINCACGNFWAGCGAIAMGQIMWYWKWPETYNWNMILPELHSYTPVNSIEQTQKFILDCATAINTQYTTCAGSWATTENIVDAFKKQFNYKSATLFKKNEGWNDKGWKNLIKTELDVRRLPLLRGGRIIQDQFDVHYFIADGYARDDDDYFHFNFGWGNDTYTTNTSYFELFKLNFITPYQGDNYHENQMVIVGISPTCTPLPEDISYFTESIIANNLDLKAKNNITLPGSNQKFVVENNAGLTLKAGNTIIMKPGFRAKNGSKLLAKIENLNQCDCGFDISVPTWYNVITPNGDNKNDVLKLYTNNANSYVVEIYDRCNNVIYKNAGKIDEYNNGLICLWNGYNVLNSCDIQYFQNGLYITTVLTIVNLFNNCGRKLEHAYLVTTLFNPSYISSLEFHNKNYNDITDTMELKTFSLDYYINPNPANDFIEINPKPMIPFRYQIIDILGNLISDNISQSSLIDINFLKSGLYLFNIYIYDKKCYFKIIKK